MSRRYPRLIACPYCGLMVQASGTSVRSHATRAREAGLWDTPCVADGKTAPKSLPPAQPADPDTRLPPHLR